MKLTITLIFLCFTCTAFGQGTQTAGAASANLDVSNINPKILTGGDAFWDLFSHAFEVPRGSGKHSIFAGALWLGGKDQQNNLYVASQTYRQGTPNSISYWPGPIATVQDAAHTAKYDKIWKVSKIQIQDHILNYNQPGYTMPSDIATWPGNGNLANGEAAKLAPFIDLDNDGIYEPAQGDYPDIKGDQALYLILNDNGNVKTPLSPAMKAEIHVMHYGFNNPANSPVFNTLFSQYRIINRGQINLTDMYAAIWTDLEIGYYNDDYVGCDTLTNRYYGYNGDNDDEGPTGYGLNPPTQSVIFLDKKMTSFIYYNNSNNFVNGDPRTAEHYYNFMRGYWRNNVPATYGGNGTDQQNPPFKYMFPGNPLTQSGWSETNTLSTPAVNIPSDRRGVGSTGPFNLAAGQVFQFTVAYNFTAGSPSINSVLQAQQDAQSVQNFFSGNLLATSNPVKINQSLQLYPNPATDQLFIRLPSSIASKEVKVQVQDNTGRTVLTTTSRQTSSTLSLDITPLSKGIYQVSVVSGNQISNCRLVKL